MVSCHTYTNWSEVWCKTQELLTPFVSILAKERGISVIGLQYVNQFRVTGARDQFRAIHLLREGSRFVPTHYRIGDVDLDAVDTNDERLIQIVTTHRMSLDQPITDGSSLLEPADGSKLD